MFREIQNTLDNIMRERSAEGIPGRLEHEPINSYQGFTCKHILIGSLDLTIGTIIILWAKTLFPIMSNL